MNEIIESYIIALKLEEIEVEELEVGYKINVSKGRLSTAGFHSMIINDKEVVFYVRDLYKTPLKYLIPTTPGTIELHKVENVMGLTRVHVKNEPIKLVRFVMNFQNFANNVRMGLYAMNA